MAPGEMSDSGLRGGFVVASVLSCTQTLATGRWGGSFWSKARVSLFSMERSCFFFAFLILAGFRIWGGGNRRNQYR